MADQFAFRIKIMPPRRMDDRASHNPTSPLKPLVCLLIGSNPRETFDDVWQHTQDRFRTAYPKHIINQGWFHKMQTVDGCDILAKDKVGSLGFGPHSPPEQLQLVILQNPIDREGSLAQSTTLRPNNFKRPSLTPDLEHHAKRRRLEQGRFGAAVEDLDHDHPVVSKESALEQDEAQGDQVWHQDDDGFTIPKKRQGSVKSMSQQALVSHTGRHSSDPAQVRPIATKKVSLTSYAIRGNTPYAPSHIDLDDENATSLPVAINQPKREPHEHDQKKPTFRGPPTPVSAEETRSSSVAPDSAQRQPAISDQLSKSTVKVSPSIDGPMDGGIADEDMLADFDELNSTPERKSSGSPTALSNVAMKEEKDVDMVPCSSVGTHINRTVGIQKVDITIPSSYTSQTAKKNAFTVLKPAIGSLTPTDWSRAEIEFLISAFNANRNSRQIARALKEELGVTRTDSAIRGQKALLKRKGHLEDHAGQPSSSAPAPSSSPAPWHSKSVPAKLKPILKRKASNDEYLISSPITRGKFTRDNFHVFVDPVTRNDDKQLSGQSFVPESQPADNIAPTQATLDFAPKIDKGKGRADGRVIDYAELDRIYGRKSNKTASDVSNTTSNHQVGQSHVVPNASIENSKVMTNTATPSKLVVNSREDYVEVNNQDEVFDHYNESTPLAGLSYGSSDDKRLLHQPTLQASSSSHIERNSPISRVSCVPSMSSTTKQVDATKQLMEEWQQSLSNDQSITSAKDPEQDMIVTEHIKIEDIKEEIAESQDKLRHRRGRRKSIRRDASNVIDRVRLAHQRFGQDSPFWSNRYRQYDDLRSRSRSTDREAAILPPDDEDIDDEDDEVSLNGPSTSIGNSSKARIPDAITSKSIAVQIPNHKTAVPYWKTINNTEGHLVTGQQTHVCKNGTLSRILKNANIPPPPKELEHQCKAEILVLSVDESDS